MATRPPPVPTLSAEGANGAIFGTLGVVLLLTLGVAVLNEKKFTGDVKTMLSREMYFGAHGTQGVISMSLSYFVSGIGAWVIFAVPQAAVIGGVVALIGYSFSTVFPLILFGLIAPAMRKNVPHGYTLNEYVSARYGPLCTFYFGLISLFYMFLYLTAEFASASTIATGLSKIPTLDSTFWNGEYVYSPQSISPILGVSLITLFYTAIGGLPVSILTDRIQGVGVLVLSIIITVACYGYAGTGDPARFSEAVGHGVHPKYSAEPGGTDYGNSFAIAITLMLAVTCANMMHAGYWQRVWAADSNSTVKVATYVSSVLSLIVMFITGITGWMAYSHYGTSIMIPGVFDITFLSIPWLICDFMGDGWAVLTLIFVIAMIASTADTLQSAMTALLLPLADKLFPGLDPKAKLAIIVVAMLFINVPAIILALSGQSILQLFLLADLLAATVVAPMFLGFWDRIHPMAAFVGGLSGMATVLVCYGVADTWAEGFDVLVKPGGLFNRSATYAFCITPVVSGLVTVGISMLIPGYRFAGYPDAASTTKGVQLDKMGASAVPDASGVSSC